MKIHLPYNGGVTLIENTFIDRYMPAANGEFVKIYLYLLRCASSGISDLSISGIADVFDHTEADVRRALNYWVKVKLIELNCDEDGSLINNFLFPSLSRTYRSFALAALGLVMILLFFIKSLPLWVLLMGVFAAGVAYAPHRSVTHSILTCAYVTWMFYTIQPWMSVPVLVGYLSHLFADTLTSAGVPYLWPYKKKFSMKAFGIKVKTGGSEEKLIGRLSILLAALGFVYLIGLILYNEVKMAGWF